MSRPLLWPLTTALLPSLFLVLSNAPSFLILNVYMNVSPTLVDGRSPRLGTGRKQVSNVNICYNINASVINPEWKGKVQRQSHCICKHELSSGMAQPKTTVLSGQLKSVSVQTAPECPAHTPVFSGWILPSDHSQSCTLDQSIQRLFNCKMLFENKDEPACSEEAGELFSMNCCHRLHACCVHVRIQSNTTD